MPNDRQDPKSFTAMLASQPADIAKLARAARALIVSVMPGVFEVVWVRQKVAGYGTGVKKKTEHFCWIAPQRAWVNLGFNYGSELPDPGGMLEGTGNKFRHVKIRTASDARRPGLKKLLVAASKHRVPPLPRATKPAAKKKRA